MVALELDVLSPASVPDLEWYEELEETYTPSSPT